MGDMARATSLNATCDEGVDRQVGGDGNGRVVARKLSFLSVYCTCGATERQSACVESYKQMRIECKMKEVKLHLLQFFDK